MFVQYLSERQQAVLLHYAHEMMRADGIIEAEESVLLETLRAQARPGIQADDAPIGNLAALFEDRLSRVALLLELMGMGFVDNRFSAGESELIRKMAAALDISHDDLNSIESWVKRQLALVEEARDLMAG